MGGTIEGGKKTAAKLTANDPDYYKKIRAKAKRTVTSTTFTSGDPRAKAAGAKGGKVSKRKKVDDEKTK